MVCFNSMWTPLREHSARTAPPCRAASVATERRLSRGISRPDGSHITQHHSTRLSAARCLDRGIDRTDAIVANMKRFKAIMPYKSLLQLSLLTCYESNAIKQACFILGQVHGRTHRYIGWA